MSIASDTLRGLLTDPGLLRMPGVFDGISAHLARRAGCAAVYLTGAGVAASAYGLPDIGLVTATEMASRVDVVSRAAGVPVLADADTGYGNATHVVRTVRTWERAGAAGLHLEDQAFPKRCGHLADKQVVSTDEHLRKLAAALEAREDGMLIVARTDARGPLGIDEAVSRALRYAAEGVDALFVEAPQSLEEIEQISDEVCRSVSIPVVFNVVPGGITPVVAEGELERLGYAAALYPGALVWPAAAAMSAALGALTGTRPLEEESSPARLFQAVGLQEWTDVDRRYS